MVNNKIKMKMTKWTQHIEKNCQKKMELKIQMKIISLQLLIKENDHLIETVMVKQINYKEPKMY
jgi:hypothetical protein